MLDGNVRAFLDALPPAGRPWQLSKPDQDALTQVPVLRARFAIEGRRVTHPPLLAWDKLARIEVRPDTPDLAELLAASHQRRDAAFFTRVATAMSAGTAVPVPCPRPELPCLAPDLLGDVLVRTGSLSTLLTWSASLAGMTQPVATRVLDTIGTLEPGGDVLVWLESAEVSALLALAL